MTVADEVREAVARLQAMGANVRLGPPGTDAEIAAAEAALGFALPDEYKEFLRDIGRIEIELVRTWFFYGLPDQSEVVKLYQEVFGVYGGEADDDARGPYVPRRFVVLADEGNYANAAEGFVWDGDLGHIRATAGDDYIERSEFYEGGYWGFLSDQLEEIHDRLADPNDVLVSGSEAEVARRRRPPT